MIPIYYSLLASSDLLAYIIDVCLNFDAGTDACGGYEKQIADIDSEKPQRNERDTMQDDTSRLDFR